MGVELAASLTERTGGVRALLTGEPDRDVDAFVLRMPRGYFLSVVPARAARHFRTIAPFLTTNEVRTAAAPGDRPGTYELLVVTNDRPALLSSVAGALAVGGISILSAQVFTTSDHVAVDLFDVEGVFEAEITEARWRSFRTTLRRVIEGATSIDRKVEEMRRHYPAPSIHTPVTVRVDHDASDFSTVLEIGAPDRMGLLYDITDVLSRAEIDVHLAKVATFDGRVVDAFYVRDELGGSSPNRTGSPTWRRGCGSDWADGVATSPVRCGDRCTQAPPHESPTSRCVSTRASWPTAPGGSGAMRSARTELMARILIVGGGYIGMYAARRLERRLPASDHVLTLVNPENFMLYQPFLPEVASGLIDPRAVVVPLRRVLRRTELVVGEVRTIDLDARRASVRLAGGDDRELDYDVVILGAGSWSRTLPIPGLAEHGVGFKDLAEAIWLRNRVLSQLDRAAELADGEAKRAALTFVFVGAGFAGIEALGELEDLARVATRTIPALDRSDQRWVMVEAAPRILPELEPNLASYAAERLRGRDIDIRTATRLERVEDGIVHLSDGEAFAAETLVWTAGVRAAPLAAGSGFPVDARGRVRVDRALRVTGWRGSGRPATSRPCPTSTRVRERRRPPRNTPCVRPACSPTTSQPRCRAAGSARSATRTRACSAPSATTVASPTRSACECGASQRGSCTGPTTCCTCRRSRGRRASRWTGRSRCCSRATSRNSAHSSTRAMRSGVRRATTVRAAGPLTHPPYSASYLNEMFTRDR